MINIYYVSTRQILFIIYILILHALNKDTHVCVYQRLFCVYIHMVWKYCKLQRTLLKMTMQMQQVSKNVNSHG